MILPNRHLRPELSLLGVGAILLRILQRPMTPSAAWEIARAYKAITTFRRYVLGLDMLYAIGAIELRDGLLVRTEGK